jgi:hypothetical protein
MLVCKRFIACRSTLFRMARRARQLAARVLPASIELSQKHSATDVPHLVARRAVRVWRADTLLRGYLRSGRGIFDNRQRVPIKQDGCASLGAQLSAVGLGYHFRICRRMELYGIRTRLCR